MADLIAGRYELGERIGAGGMAEVFRAHDHQLDRSVAVKILNREYISQPAFVERFRREAQAAASLNHPSIVPIYDWGQTDESYYIVMAYVAGHTLREAFVGRHPAPIGEVLATIANVAAGLQHAHDRGIVHRDIKPRNILIDQEGNPRITDFGIARAAGQSSLTETSVVLGTAAYMSPEQAMRRPIDARSDIYSLGVVTYELLAGQLPFRGESIVDLAMQHAHEQPPPIRSIRPDVPEGVEQVVLACLAKDPDQRIQTAGEVVSALERVRENPAAVPVTAPTVPVSAAASPAAETVPARGIQGSRSRPASARGKGAIWAAIAAVGIAVVVLLVLLVNQFGDSNGPDAGVNDGTGGEATPQIDEGAAPGQTEDSGEEAAPAEDTPDDGATESQPTEPAEEQDPETPDEEQEDVPPDDPPTDAPGQNENQGAEEPPADGETEGDEERAGPQSAPAELAADGICDGTYESVDVSRVTVPGDETCSLISGRVEDGVVIEPGGTLQAAGVEILDNIRADQADSLSLTGNSYVDGNVRYSGGGPLRVAESTVEGNLELESNPGTIQISASVVDGNVQVQSNTGGVTIADNQIDGNLECTGNNPPPSGGGNNVVGNYEDQCADL